VGKTVTTFGTDGHVLWEDGLVDFSRTATSTTMRVNKNTHDGDLISFSKDGTTVGSIGTLNSRLVIGSGDTAVTFANNLSPKSFYPSNTSGTGQDASINLGTTTSRFKDLYLSGGLRGDTTFKNNAGTTEYARFDSSGNLLVGTTDTTLYNNSDGSEGVRIAEDHVSIASDARTVFYVNRQTSDGEIINIRKDGTTVGSIGSASGNRIYIGTGNSTLGFSPVVNAVYGYSGDNTVDLGTSATRFKDLYLSGGVSNPSGSLTFDTTGGEAMRIDSSGNVGIGETNPSVTLDISATDAVQMPAGTTAQRPTGANGMIRYNSDDGSFEGYADGAWGAIGGGGDQQTATTTSTTQTAIATYTASSSLGIEITVIATDTVATERTISKLLVTHDGTTAVATEYGTVNTDTAVATFDVDISGGNVRLLATAASANSTNFTANAVILA